MYFTRLFKMHYLVCITGIFLQVLQLFTIIQCQCPEYFRYFRNETNGEIMGTVEIPIPPQGVSLHLRVILSVTTVLPTKYVGRLELAKSKEESIKSVLQHMPLFYQIYFPVRNPIPVVTSITLNEVQYCSGLPAAGVIVTNIILEHTLYPPTVIIPLTEQLFYLIYNHTNSSLTSSNSNFFMDKEKVVKETTTMTSSNFQFNHLSKHSSVDSSCGLTSESNLLITSSESISPIMWPWLAAIFFVKEKLEFQCAGNLISRQYVLTVAHCLKESKENIPPNMLLVSLGRFNLRDWKEPGSVNVDVIDYKFHPDYENFQSADSDLAIIKLMERIKYTPSIRPVCLWMGKVELNNIVGKFGYVAGWGYDGKNNCYSSELRTFKVPIVSQEDCLRSSLRFIEVTSNRTFCAGRRDGTGPCNGDTGSGLVMLHMRYIRYHLRGIISSSLLDIRTRSCDLKEYIVYVDIAKYLPWIQKEIIS